MRGKEQGLFKTLCVMVVLFVAGLMFIGNDAMMTFAIMADNALMKYQQSQIIKSASETQDNCGGTRVETTDSARKTEEQEYNNIKTEETDNDNVEKNSSSYDKKTTGEKYNSVLNIQLKGKYLDVYNKSTTNCNDEQELIMKVALQILQEDVIVYDYAEHYYALSYTNTADVRNAKFYDLKDAIKKINNGQEIYTDCFGFVRLVHCIACYSINNLNPDNVAGISGLYGYKGAYTGKEISGTNLLTAGCVIYDRLTGSDGYRHVAMFAYCDGNKIVYLDQKDIFEGEYIPSQKYIYKDQTKPYKFNTYKSYC